MKVVPDTRPRPRLFTDIIAPRRPKAQKAQKTRRFKFTPGRLSRFMVRVAIVALVAAAVAFWSTHPGRIREEASTIRQLVAVGTRMLSSGTRPTDPPNAIVVQLNAQLVQVTSIALGHPRLAVINGKQVTEGDWIVVHTPTRSVSISLRVLEISDRQVKLSDGTQVITAHLAMADETLKKRNEN